MSQLKLSLWQKVLLGMLLGTISGFLCPSAVVWFESLASIYINLVKMIVVPTIFCAVLYGITNLSDIKMVGRLGLRSFGLYFLATISAVIIGIVIALWLRPGVGFALNWKSTLVSSAALPAISMAELFVNIFPANPLAAMVEGNTLQVIFFAFVLGISMILAGEKAASFKRGVVSCTAVVFKMVELVVRVTPYGTYAIVAFIVGKYGFSVLVSLGKLAVAVMGGFVAQYLFFGVILAIFKLAPRYFFRKTFNLQSIAFATSSSKATLVSALSDLKNKLGVSAPVAGFVLPLGTAINMTGSAIYIVICALFCAQAYGVSLSLHQYVILALVSTIGSIGAAGYPSGAVIMLGMVLPTLGLPIEMVPLIMGIDRILDMFRTVVNVVGDCAVTVISDSLEGTLNLAVYYDKKSK